MKKSLRTFLSVALLGVSLSGCGGEAVTPLSTTECGPGRPLVLTDGLTVSEVDTGEVEVVHVGRTNTLITSHEGSFYIATTEVHTSVRLETTEKGLGVGEWGSYNNLGVTEHTDFGYRMDLQAVDYILEPPPVEFSLETVELCQDSNRVTWMRRPGLKE